MSKVIQPEQMAQSGSEDGEQLALYCWIALKDLYEGPIKSTPYPQLERLFHIPNGGFRDKREAAKLRGMGVKRGVPDLCLPVRMGDWSGLYIELKKVKGKDAREEQSEWGEYLKSQGYGFVVCKGWLEARSMLIQYLSWEDHV